MPHTTPRCRFLYVTTKDRRQAITIGRALVQEKLAACVNIIDKMHAIYRWQGKIEEADEAVLIVKTAAPIAAVRDRIRDLHSYTCPCIAAIDITDGAADYLDWIVRESTIS